jgi:hypothetical protein
MMGSDRAGETNQPVSVVSAEVSDRAAASSCSAASSSSTSRAAAMPSSMPRTPAARSFCTDSRPRAAPTSISPITLPPITAMRRARCRTRRLACW